MFVKSGIFIVVLYSITVDLILSKSWYSTHGQASCNSCCPSIQHLEFDDDDLPDATSCSSINVDITKKQNAQIRLAKPKFKQYRKKLINGKRPNNTVVTFDDDEQIDNILERYGELFADRRPRKFPEPFINSAKPKPTPNSVPQNDMGEEYKAPLWQTRAMKPNPTPKVGYSSWTYTYSSKSRTKPVHTRYTGSPGTTVTQTVVGKRKKRDAIKKIEVCPTRESWQDLNLALNSDGKLVQIVQLKDQKQWILEESCSKKTSKILPNVSCENRPRVITAVVVPLSGARGSSEIQVQEIQIQCCAAYYVVP